ncbi:MAG: DUF3530 family protein [Granulosicoccus sp.]
MKNIYFGSLIAILSFPLFATNVEREQRWIEQTVDSIFDGEPVFLDSDGHRFLGIFTESSSSSSKAIIVLHGTGLHPDWEQVVRPVRVRMTEFGWNTLSIQLPLLAKSAAYQDYVSLYPEVPVRLQAATDFLLERGMSTIVVVAHSQGATMASYYLAQSEHNIEALVAIGMSAQHNNPEINSAQSLKLITIPVLDIYGSRDFPTVLETSLKRRQAASHNARYSQLVIADAYHFFDDSNHERMLIDTIVRWLADEVGR